MELTLELESWGVEMLVSWMIVSEVMKWESERDMIPKACPRYLSLRFFIISPGISPSGTEKATGPAVPLAHVDPQKVKDLRVSIVCAKASGSARQTAKALQGGRVPTDRPPSHTYESFWGSYFKKKGSGVCVRVGALSFGAGAAAGCRCQMCGCVRYGLGRWCRCRVPLPDARLFGAWGRCQICGRVRFGAWALAPLQDTA